MPKTRRGTATGAEAEPATGGADQTVVIEPKQRGRPGKNQQKAIAEESLLPGVGNDVLFSVIDRVLSKRQVSQKESGAKTSAREAELEEQLAETKVKEAAAREELEVWKERARAAPPAAGTAQGQQAQLSAAQIQGLQQGANASTMGVALLLLPSGMDSKVLEHKIAAMRQIFPRVVTAYMALKGNGAWSEDESAITFNETDYMDIMSSGGDQGARLRCLGPQPADHSVPRPQDAGQGDGRGRRER